MDRATVSATLDQVFTKVFGRPIGIHDAMTASNVEGWDSMTNIRLLDAVERQFGISFSVTEVMSLASVGSLIDVIHAKKSA